MRTVFIIHFNPLELYPPVQNEINSFKDHPAYKIYVVTTNSVNNKLDKFIPPSSNVHILRFGQFSMQMATMKRYLNFIKFYAGCFFKLLKKWPSRVLYYETMSSYPVYLFKKFFNKRAEVFIHYHEYTSPEELANGSGLVRFFHQKERKLFPLTQWVSHTNADRMRRFENDILPVTLPVKKILPNYPPRSWHKPAKEKIQKPVKLVYVGALSLRSMYTAEFAHWIAKQGGDVTLDIYSYNRDEEIESFLTEFNCPFIALKDGINYTALPNILRQYDVGVILYTGFIPNHVFSAPNKLFEYLVCGLDVWFPHTIKGSLPYIRTDGYPKIIALDFLKLDDFNLNEAISRQASGKRQISYSCEDALAELNSRLFN